ncbi:uncharacterized protein LOC122311390 [Carya illinoinensis]|uniref:uncharacterized protein LOC122311390 n=1 Tax=Carya illinoinensis TaxID=32201 RepID=UPI001C728E28|nr:uncharacterized protein LOC122311390 [Carya illinoinensis]
MNPFSNFDDDYADYELNMMQAIAMISEGTSSTPRRTPQRRRFIRRDSFEVVSHDDYFVQKRDASGRLGLSSLQKMTAAIRMLAYGVTADLMDEYIKIEESTVRQSMKKFVKAIVSIFGNEYLRSPNSNNIVRF